MFAKTEKYSREREKQEQSGIGKQPVGKSLEMSEKQKVATVKLPNIQGCVVAQMNTGGGGYKWKKFVIKMQ